MIEKSRATWLLLVFVGLIVGTACDTTTPVSEAPDQKQVNQTPSEQTALPKAHTRDAPRTGPLSTAEVRRLLEHARARVSHDEVEAEASAGDSLLDAALQNIDAYKKNDSNVEYVYGDEALVKMGVLPEAAVTGARTLSHSARLQRLFAWAKQENVSMTRRRADSNGEIGTQEICVEPSGSNCYPPPDPPPPEDPPDDDDPDFEWGGSSYSALAYDSFWNEFTATYAGETWASQYVDRISVGTTGLFNGSPIGAGGFENSNWGIASVFFEVSGLEPRSGSSWNFATAASIHRIKDSRYTGGNQYQVSTNNTTQYFLP